MSNITELELARGNVKNAMKSVGASSGDLWRVPPTQLRVIEGFNARVHNAEYDQHIEAITQSIVENGYYQDKPLAGYVAREDDGDVIYITDGHTRHAAVNRAIERGAAIETIPVVIKPNGTTMEDLTIALVTSNNGKPFTPYETALVVKRLVDMGLEEKVIAKRLNLGTAYVKGLLELAGAPKALRTLVQDGKVAPTLAISTLRKHGANAVAHLKSAVEEANALGKTKATGKHVKKVTDKEAKPKLVARVEEVSAVEEDGEALIEVRIYLPAGSELARGDAFVIGKITKYVAPAEPDESAEDGEVETEDGEDL